jgi:hypothetical protein
MNELAMGTAFLIMFLAYTVVIVLMGFFLLLTYEYLKQSNFFQRFKKKSPPRKP